MEKDMVDMAVLITADALADMVDTVPMDIGAGDTEYGSMDVCGAFCWIICVRL